MFKEVLLEVLINDEHVLKEKEQIVYVDELADSAVILGIRCWFKNEEYWEGKWRITEKVKYALDENEIEIPYPQMDVHVDNLK